MSLAHTAPRAAAGVMLALLLQSCTDASQSRVPTGPGDGGTNVTAGEILVGAGNIAKCTTTGDEATANLLDAIPGTVVALGDNTITGTLADYTNCYGPTWGRHLARTRAVLGNHEYDPGNADASFDYFGDRVGPRGLGYYSFDVGAWHVIVLNDNGAFVPFGAGSVQEQWLLDDLAANTRQCTLAMWHTPLFQSSNTAGFVQNSSRRILWTHLYAAGADVVLSAQAHHYERMAPMRPDSTRDDATGIRQFNVGTGGESVALPTVAIHPNSEVRGGVFGVLKLSLEPGRYSWEFVPVAGQTFSDSGSAPCNGAATNAPPTAAFTASCAGLGCAFTDGSSDADGQVTAWSWEFGDGATATTRNPSHTYATGGTYTVRLTVTDDAGATATKTAAVTVNRPPVADPGGPYRSEAEVRFDGGGSTDPDGDTPLTFAWVFGDGAAGSGPAPTHTYSADGTYTVTLTVTDARGAAGAPVQTTATIGNLPPDVHAGPDAQQLPGLFTLRATFSDPGADDAPWRYTIAWGDGLTSSGSVSAQGTITATHPYLLPGAYRVRVTVTDKDGGVGADELTLTVRIL